MCIKGWSPVGTFHLGVFLLIYKNIFMDDEKKFEITSYVASISLIASCWGRGIYEESTHDHYTNYQDKVPMETIFLDSCITSIILSFITWVVLTLYDCNKKAKISNSSTFELFKKELFTKNTLITFVVLCIVIALITLFGIIFIGLAFFLWPLLKGKFK